MVSLIQRTAALALKVPSVRKQGLMGDLDHTERIASKCFGEWSSSKSNESSRLKRCYPITVTNLTSVAIVDCSGHTSIIASKSKLLHMITNAGFLLLLAFAF